MDHELTKLVLGALLHDIGKFKQRARFEEDEGKTHVDVGYNWLVSQYGEGVIASGARNHHGNEPETWETNLGLIFYESDNCSASERCPFEPDKDIGKAWHRQMRLGNIFAHVRNPTQNYTAEAVSQSSLAPGRGGRDERENTPTGSYWPLKPLGQWCEPDNDHTRQNTSEDYRTLWNQFEETFNDIREVGNHLNIEVMLHLLEKYTSFIPSITLKIQANTDEETYRKHPDVSLFDHLKLAAAVATSLYHYHSTIHQERWNRGNLDDVLKEEITGEETWNQASTSQPFLLVGGDLSGVQKFIYTISSKGALKSLKGRSFFLELLTEHVVDRLLDELNQSRCNVVFTGGGHFYLIAPHTQPAIGHINTVRTEINDYLFDAFGGTLWQAIEWVPFNKASLGNPSEVWSGLSGKLESAKRRKWGDNLAAILGHPEAPEPSCETTNCAVCGREDQPLASTSVSGDIVEMCTTCGDQFRLGHHLQQIGKGEWPVIYRWDRPPHPSYRDACIKIGKDRPRYYQPAAGQFGKGLSGLLEQASAVYHLNDWNLHHFTHHASRPLMAGIYAYREDGAVPDLNTMVTGGYGMDRLGVLRMDVDHLGTIFTKSMPQEERTFSRMASLSRNLSLFFKYHLNGILDVAREDGYEKLRNTHVASRSNGQGADMLRLTIVYSGGDDLFLIGHWLDITEAAFDIREAFKRFTGNNVVTISGGMTLGASHDPVYRLAQVAGEAEMKAKNAGRDAVTLFGTKPWSWGDALAIRQKVTNVFGPLLEPSDNHWSLPTWSFSKSFLYRVLALTKEYSENDALVLPKLAYLVGRNGPNERNLERYQHEAWMELKNNLVTLPTMANKNRFQQIETATQWTLMLLRKGEG